MDFDKAFSPKPHDRSRRSRSNSRPTILR